MFFSAAAPGAGASLAATGTGLCVCVVGITKTPPAAPQLLPRR